MAIREEVIKDFQRDIYFKDKRKYNGYMSYYRTQYLRNKKRGDYSIVIDEWDKYEQDIIYWNPNNAIFGNNSQACSNLRPSRNSRALN